MTGLAQGVEIAQALSREHAVLQRLATLLCYGYFALAVTFSASAATNDTRKPSINTRFVPLWTLAASLLTAIPVLHPGKLSATVAIPTLLALFAVPLALLLIRRVPSTALPSLYPNRAAPRVEAVFFTFGVLLCVAVIIWNVTLPRDMNSVGVVYAGFGFWTFFFTMTLVVWPRRIGLPSLVLVGVGLVLVFAIWNDNHYFHGCEHFDFDGTSGQDWCQGGWPPPSPAPPAPQAFDAHVKTWLRANCLPQARRDPRPCPMIFVAAEGGGARAAYWTALVLQDLDSASRGAFHRHLFALSTVSGGTLGSTAFLGSLAHPNAPRGALQEFTGDDFLSPILAALLFPEVVQRFWPFPVDAFDRAHAFEHSLELSWKRVFKSDEFAKDFIAFWTPENERGGPAIFMNSTNVESGIPFVISNLDLPVTYHERSYYAFDHDRLYHITSLPMSAAVHLSSRFSYVNPPATLYGRISKAALESRKECADSSSQCAREIVPWGRLVDGGYYDDSGTYTLLGVLRSTKRVIDALPLHDPLRAINPEFLVLVITNSADVAYDPDPQFDKELVPERPREPAKQYLTTYEEPNADPPSAGQVTRIAYGTTWSKHVGESDLTSPPQAFFTVGGSRSVNDQWTLASLTGQYALATAESCYGHVSGKKGITTANALNICVPNAAPNQLLQANGCPSTQITTPKVSPQQQLAAVLSDPTAAISCQTFMNFQKLSYAHLELRIRKLDRSGQFGQPALGWALSFESQQALSKAACAGFEGTSSKDRDCGAAPGYGYRQIVSTLKSYASPTLSTPSTQRVQDFVRRAHLPPCPPRGRREAVQRSLRFYRMSDGTFCKR